MSEVKIAGRAVDTLVLNVCYADGHLRPLKQELANEMQQELEQLQSVARQEETALAKETKGKSTVLFPIRLDDTVMASSTAWAAHIKNTRHIGDFTQWINHDDYQRAFNRLLRDLKAEA